MYNRTLKNRMKIFGVLFLFTTCFLFFSCSKDDDDYQPIQLQYAILNDKPNPVTNNQISLNFPSETKNELIIFGGDGKYAINNSDNTKLSISYADGYLTLTPLAAGNVTVTITDTHNNFYALTVQIINQLELNISAKKEAGNIFDLMVFNLNTSYEGRITLLDLTETYDSIVWLCTNTSQRFRVLESQENSGSFTWQWSNCFFLPAVYETCVLGYKDSQIISSDTVYVDIANDKDFLGFKWEDVVSKVSTGYENIFSDEYYFVTHKNVTNNIPSISLFLSKNYIENEAAFFSKSRKILFDYICLLYSSPTYSSDGDNSILDIYNDLFRNKKEAAVPESIWVTSKSNIVLLEEYDSISGYSNYKIYAEPK